MSPLPGWLREILRCPVCKSELVDVAAELGCTGCGRHYRIDQGIPVLLPDEAREGEPARRS